MRRSRSSPATTPSARAIAIAAAIPMQVFYDYPLAGRFQVRFAFCIRKEVLSEALSRLSALRPG
jgi:hypothetical protein